MIDIINRLAMHTGIYAENLKTGKTYKYNQNDIFPAASVIKLPVLYELFQQYIYGNITPQNHIVYNRNTFVEDSPWFEKKDDGEYQLSDIAHAMITVSDNVSTNLLIDLLGFK